MADPLLSFFATRESQGCVVVKDTPKLDIELYIQNYKGRTRFDRLFLIGQTSQTLCVDALKAATAEAKTGKDVQRYRDAVSCLRAVAPSDPEADLDLDWIANTEAANKAQTARLETELKVYKNNLIKESIRMGNEDLGKHYESIGDLNKAMEAYSRMKPDISTPKHIMDVAKHVINLALQRQDWAIVSSQVNKMIGNNQTPDEEAALQPYLKVVAGIAYLGQERYLEAALSFLQTVQPTAQTSYYTDIVSPNDVAIYGGLLALASMDRTDLQAKVLDNSTFRFFLEVEPQIRRAVSQFVNARYSACLATLESYRQDCLLDIYLQRHVKHIYNEIRTKCIVQYLVPFSCATLQNMNEAFAAPGESIEKELVTIIKSGRLNARIDAINKLVVTVKPDTRVTMQLRALETAKAYEKEMIERIRRMSLIAADLEVKGARRPPGMAQGMGGSRDDAAEAL